MFGGLLWGGEGRDGFVDGSGGGGGGEDDDEDESESEVISCELLWLW
jgi:hypothetical protein